MGSLNIQPYRPDQAPSLGSVPVTVIVLTKNEAVNIDRCIASVSWAAQIVVVDSESTDDTVERARMAGAEVVIEPWRGFGAQREFALRLSIVKHDWVYFMDADEWASQNLAIEIAELVSRGEFDAYAQRFRLVFMGRWIKHCGWYGGSWIVRLMRASKVHFGSDEAGERVQVESVGRLVNDIVDHDLKGLSSWLHKHIRYAELEVKQARPKAPIIRQWREFWTRRRVDTRPVLRAIAKDLILPRIPGKPIAIFLYMYVIRLGFLDGRSGLLFCLMHAWYRLTIQSLQRPEADAAKNFPIQRERNSSVRGVVHH